MLSSSAPDIQSRTLRTFTALYQLRTDWGGALILSIGLGPQGAALAFASNIAGAVCLSLEEDSATAHAALRSGACDFVVNSLDEALRAVKNEVRKHLPISVGLQGSYSEVLSELLERGVAPDLVADLSDSRTDSDVLEAFWTQGSLILDFGPATATQAAVSVEDLLHAALTRHDWRMEQFLQPTTAALRAFDAEVLKLVPPGDPLRTKWLHAAPKILPRESPIQRSLWLTPEEIEVLKQSRRSDGLRDDREG